MKRARQWQRIRQNRLDLTDYLIHLTKQQHLPDEGAWLDGREVLLRILDDGYIKASFAPLANRYNKTPKPTVRGKRPAVCLTEQPLWSLVQSLKCFVGRYDGYGIAYHKVPLYWRGARPVIYGDSNTLAALPEELQHLFVTYEPGCDPDLDPVDFTWEREWRIVPYRPPWYRTDHLELTFDNGSRSPASGP